MTCGHGSRSLAGILNRLPDVVWTCAIATFDRMVMQTVKKASITFLARLLFFGQEWTKIEEGASAGEAVMAAMAAMAWHRAKCGWSSKQTRTVVVAATADMALLVATADVVLLLALVDMLVATTDVTWQAVTAAVAVVAASADVAVMKDVAMEWYQALFLGRHKPQLGGKRPTRYI
uniref:Uncharacterized protein n=1 Tax=Phytophthora ramorum TaxID=164328 RepID=H3GF68_PHYRM